MRERGGVKSGMSGSRTQRAAIIEESRAGLVAGRPAPGPAGRGRAWSRVGPGRADVAVVVRTAIAEDGGMRAEARALGQALLVPGQYTIRYGVLCDRAGVPHVLRIVGTFLGEVAEWCDAEGFPPLNLLAVGENGVPGEGYDGAGGFKATNGRAMSRHASGSQVIRPQFLRLEGSVRIGIMPAMLNKRSPLLRVAVVLATLITGCVNVGPGTAPRFPVAAAPIAPGANLVDSSPTSKTAVLSDLALKAEDGTTLGTVSGLRITAHRTTDGAGNPATRITVDGVFVRRGFCVAGPDGQRFAVSMRNAAGGEIRRLATDPMPVTSTGSDPGTVTAVLADLPAEEYTTMAIVVVIPRAATWVRC